MSINLHRIRQKSNEFESFTSFMSVCQMEHMFRKTFEALRTWFNRKYLSVTKSKGHWMKWWTITETEHTLFGTQELLAGSPLIPIPRRNVHHQSGVSTYGTDRKLNTYLHRLHVLSIWKVNAFSIDKPGSCQGNLHKYHAMRKRMTRKRKAISLN